MYTMAVILHVLVCFLMIASILLLDRYATSASSSYFPVLMPVLLLSIPIIDTDYNRRGIRRRSGRRSTPSGR